MNLCIKFGEATLSRFGVISLFPHKYNSFPSLFHPYGRREKVSHRGALLPKKMTCRQEGFLTPIESKNYYKRKFSKNLIVKKKRS